MRMKRTLIVLASVLLAFLVGVLAGRGNTVGLALDRWVLSRTQTPMPPIVPRTPEAPEKPAQQEVVWYEPDPRECRLVEGRHSLPLPAPVLEKAQTIIEARLAERLAANAPHVSGIFLDDRKDWVLVLSDSARLEQVSSSCEAGISLYAMVDTLLANFPGTRRVRLLDHDAGGRPLRHWGPLDASAPLVFNDWSAKE